MSQWYGDNGPEIDIAPMQGPMQVVVQQVQSPGGANLLAFNIYTPFGRAVYILTAEQAAGISTMLFTESELALQGGAQLEVPEDWLDEHAGQRVPIDPDKCPKRDRAHKAHTWEQEFTGDTIGYFKCRGNW